MNLKYQIQKPGSAWADETGAHVPFNRLSNTEKVKERLAGLLLKEAIKLNDFLQRFKVALDKSNVAVMTAMINDEKLPKNTKGNFTWYNFDRSIKVEININETIRFDEALIASAREVLDKFISDNLQGTADVVRELINQAFQNNKGGLDSKKVLSLLKYRTKIKDKRFHHALDLIEQSISRPSSKKYFRVWAKDDQGAYQNIDLNFSSI